MEGSSGSRPHVSFEVEKIIGISSDGNYQVQWKPAWVSKFHLVGCEHLIEEFLLEQYHKGNEPQTHVPNKPNDMALVETDTPTMVAAVQGQNCVTSGYVRFGVDALTHETDTSYTENTLFEYPVDTPICPMSESSKEEDFQSDLNQDSDMNIKIEEKEESETLPDQSTIALMNQSSPRSSPPDDVSYPQQPTVTPEPMKEGRGSLEPNENELPQESVKKNFCYVCSKQFPDQRQLRRHFQTHSGARPFACKFCQKGFPTHGHLKQHLQSHASAKPFACEVCGKSFSWKGDLKRHKRIHTGLKPYGCDNCKKKFSDSSNRNYHARRCGSNKT